MKKNPPLYEKLSGDPNEFYFQRINARRRPVYKASDGETVAAIYSMWTHCELSRN